MPQSVVSVFDLKQALMITSATAPPLEASVRWSNNGNFVAMARSYFEARWEKSVAMSFGLVDLSRDLGVAPLDPLCFRRFFVVSVDFISITNIKGVGLRMERWDTTGPSSADCGAKTLADYTVLFDADEFSSGSKNRPCIRV
jgi:hypothetical protein